MKKIYCSNCGQLVEESANFCRYCGAALRGAESSQFRATAKPAHPAEVQKKQYLADPKLTALANELVPRRHLTPAAKLLFFINYVGITSLLLPLFAVGIYFEPLVAALLATYFVILYSIAVLVYNHFYFSVETEGFRIDYGIINKRHITVPFRQIQNVNITRTLVDRMLGIGKLEIESAGSTQMQKRDVVGGTRSKAEGFLPGLTMKEAEHLHDLILQKSMYEQQKN
ncbi:MAG: PH domain-containing protein [Candidatus Saccharimonadales bacterium]